MENPFAQVLCQRAWQRISAMGLEARRAAVDAGVVAAAGLMVVAAIGCAVAALWLLLAPLVGAAGAALSAAAALLAMGGTILGVRAIVARRRARPAANSGRDCQDLAEALQLSFSANKAALLLAALAAGAAAADARRRT